MSEQKVEPERFEEDGMTTRIENDTSDQAETFEGGGPRITRVAVEKFSHSSGDTTEQLELDLGVMEQAVRTAHAKQRAAALGKLIDALAYFSPLDAHVSRILRNAADLIPELRQAIIDAGGKAGKA